MFNRLLSIVFCVMLSACGTSYHVAPSTSRVETRVATAVQSNKEARKRTAEIESSTKDTQIASKTTAEHIEAALRVMAAGDYVTAAQELILAKASNELVQTILQQSLRNVTSLGDSLKTTEQNLGDAQGDIKDLNKEIKKVTEQGAKDRAIVEEVNWGFRVGALLYFVKGVLAMGFWSIIILAVALIVLLAIGGPCALFAMKAISWILNLVRKK